MAFSGERYAVQLLTAATATNSPPSGASAGVEVNSLKFPEDGLLVLKSTAGSGTMTVTCRAWGYDLSLAAWFPLGTGAAATKGVINGGDAIGETEADTIAHGEILSGSRHLTRVYLEITAIGGTATAISAWLVARV